MVCVNSRIDRIRTVIYMRGAVFDVDGTILDSMGIWYTVTVSFLADHGVCITPEQADAYSEMTLEQSLPYLKDQFLPHMSVKEISDGIFSMLSDEYSSRVQAKPGVCEYIHRLHSGGVRIAVATSSYARLCRSAFKRLGIDGCISAYAFSHEVGCGKDKPDIYLLAAKKLGLAPEECTVFEDLLTGVISARSAGFYVTAVADHSNITDTQRLIQNSDRYITGWDELLSK